MQFYTGILKIIISFFHVHCSFSNPVLESDSCSLLSHGACSLLSHGACLLLSHDACLLMSHDKTLPDHEKTGQSKPLYL